MRGRSLPLALLLMAAPAVAQGYWTGSAVNAVNHGAANCTPSVSSVLVANNGTEIQVRAVNGTPNWISVGMSVRIVASGLDRTVSMASWSDPRPPGDTAGVFRITGINPVLPAAIPNATVTVTTNCAIAPAPGGPPRNWR